MTDLETKAVCCHETFACMYRTARFHGTTTVQNLQQSENLKPHASLISYSFSWIMTPCSMAYFNQSFAVSWVIHLQLSRVTRATYASILKADISSTLCDMVARTMEPVLETRAVAVLRDMCTESQRNHGVSSRDIRAFGNILGCDM
jgi:hypothetical protein